MAEAFTPERVLHLKRAIHDHMQSNGVYGQIRDILAEFAASEGDLTDRSPDALLSLIEERGMLHKVLSSFDVAKAPASDTRRAVTTAGRRQGGTHGTRYLHMQILGGRAFLDNLDVDARVAAQHRLYCQVHFGSQRFRTGMVECVCEPPLDDDFVINLEAELTLRKVKDLVALSVPLHVLVLRYDTATGMSTYVGENTVEWRKVLSNGRVAFSVELGSGSGIGVSCGVLNIDVSFLGPASASYSEDDVAQYLASERSHVTAAEREFVLYSKRWWNEYQALHPAAANRKVKVFVGVGSNTGIHMVPITSLVQPLRAGRLLSSPMEAARFVSLIPLYDGASHKSTESNLTGGENAVTMSQFAFLCTRQGDVHNHCIVLCSLFLGFGLDAYCVTGTRHDAPSAPTMWVLTRSSSGVYFWDPSSGTSVLYRSGSKSAAVARVWSVFNNQGFFANAQDDDAVEFCQFDFLNDSAWKPMNPVKLRLVAHHVSVPLLAPTLDAADLEERLEDGIVGLISEHRARLGLPVSWDSDGGYVLTQSLVAYETARVLDNAVPALCQDLFQSAIRQRIPDGHTFKGFPVSTTHTSVSRLMHQIISSPTGRDIVECVGDDVHFMLRVKAFVYPEDVVSVWAMIAVRYRTSASPKKH